ncbi:hypothetical protein SFSGTM_31530 [Sulfuriferula nivalis]|uniref:DUF1415 domain-containing protein n=1 Tax=Sulfuriferula nivalis TaxID=2675298 RepID=A0A809RM03_9PROT|nr:hypothetical protein SFSGTM_31530 [Sulfuriferula nivalis]
MELENTQIIKDTQDWLEKAVIGLNLCPFAKAVHVKQQIRYVVSTAKTEAALLDDLLQELDFLMAADPEVVDTTLLIHPWVLTDFLDYNDFLDVADGAAAEPEFNDALQIASFHPQYQFADTELDDIANFTNRSPYPMLHLLREDSIDRAVAAFPEADAIYEKNMQTLRELGLAGWKKLMAT